MAEATAFNVTSGLEVERKYMTTWVNVGTSETKSMGMCWCWC